MHVTAPEDVADEDSNNHSPKDLSTETGLDGIAADASLRRTQLIQEETRMGKSL